VALSKAVGEVGPDIVLCGKQAVDDDCGAVAIEIAEMLGMPHVHGAVKLDVSEDGSKAVAHREIDGGQEIVEVNLPAVITCEKGLNEPRYASLKGIMRAKKKPIDTKDEAALGLTADQVGQAASKTKLKELRLPSARQAGRKFDGEPADMAPEVVKLLHEEARII
jgi:electron transfer flavoprotein beta subunit